MLQVAVDAALEAGKFLIANVGKIKSIERKGGQETNLVTEVDKKAEQIIIGRIKEKYPDHDFLGEESGSAKITSDYRWIIDPLDGTINYTHGVPVICVSIALEHNGEIEVGVVYDPNLNELFTAEKGKGARLNNQKIQVSKTTRLIESLIVTGFPYDIRDNPDPVLSHFRNFLTEAQALRRPGSAAMDLCYVSAGRFDGFWEGLLNPWDMAAGVLMVTEAGGKWTDFRGLPTTVYGKQMLATNGLIHDKMLDVLKKSLK